MGQTVKFQERETDIFVYFLLFFIFYFYLDTNVNLTHIESEGERDLNHHEKRKESINWDHYCLKHSHQVPLSLSQVMCRQIVVYPVERQFNVNFTLFMVNTWNAKCHILSLSLFLLQIFSVISLHFWLSVGSYWVTFAVKKTPNPSTIVNSKERERVKEVNSPAPVPKLLFLLFLGSETVERPTNTQLMTLSLSPFISCSYCLWFFWDGKFNT